MGSCLGEEATVSGSLALAISVFGTSNNTPDGTECLSEDTVELLRGVPTICGASADLSDCIKKRKIYTIAK